MAFELKVEKFCDGCGFFDADVMKFKKCMDVRDVVTDHIHKYTDTYISCKHLAHCKKLHGEKLNMMDDGHHMDADEMKSTLERLCEKFGIEIQFEGKEDIDNG